MVRLPASRLQTNNFAIRCQEARRAAVVSGFAERLFPNAKKKGEHLICGNLYGDKGQSFLFNLSGEHIGRWHDFQSKEDGDVIDIYAKRQGVTIWEALEKIEEECGLRTTSPLPGASKPRKALPAAPISGEPTKRWVYTDENGKELYQAKRWEKPGHSKSCRMAIKAGTSRVPLYLPEILSAVKNKKLIFITEGEPKADLLKKWNLTATTFAGGVNGYKADMAKWFAGAAVVILIDSDQPGREFGKTIANDIAAGDNLGVKIIELPGAAFEGYDLIDWHKDGGTYEQLAAIVKAAPYFEGGAKNEKPQGLRPLEINPNDFLATRDINSKTVPYKWLITNSFRRGQLGGIFGAPGAGKGMFTLQLGLQLVASISPFGVWEAEDKPIKFLYISAEDDEVILRNRTIYTLDSLPVSVQVKDLAAANFCRVPVHGLVSLCDTDMGKIVPTQNLEDLRNIIANFKPDLLALDTMARFFGLDENDNTAVTAACGLLENIIHDFGCNIIVIHHSNKSGSDIAVDKKTMMAALSQTAIRGASALAGAIRWGLLMTPLSDKLAVEIIGSEAEGKAPGTYVAIRVAKKNAGPSEQVFYLERGEHGLFTRVMADSDKREDEAIMGDAQQLAEEIIRRAANNEPALTPTSAGRIAFKWGLSRTQRVVQMGLDAGLLIKEKKQSGNGHILAAPPQEQENNNDQFRQEAESLFK